jgi:putative restriction endonuclease
VPGQPPRDGEGGGEEPDGDQERMVGGAHERGGVVAGAEHAEQHGADHGDAERHPELLDGLDFGPANGVGDETRFLERLGRLARRQVGLGDLIGCVAVSECVLFDPDAWVDVPPSFNPQNLSGSVIDLAANEGRRLWAECLERASAAGPQFEWVAEAADRQRRGQPQMVIPRLGQGSFRLAVLDAYGGACAITGEHALPALEAAHIRPWSSGGPHELPNGLPLRRDLHRLFDLGYVSARPDGEFLVSPLLRKEFDNGHTYYALEGRQLLDPRDAAARPSQELLAWHS